MKESTCLTWRELQIGDFFIDKNNVHYGIKIADNTFFDLETNHIYSLYKRPVEIPHYYKCDYEVW